MESWGLNIEGGRERERERRTERQIDKQTEKGGGQKEREREKKKQTNRTWVGVNPYTKLHFSLSSGLPKDTTSV